MGTVLLPHEFVSEVDEVVPYARPHIRTALPWSTGWCRGKPPDAVMPPGMPDSLAVHTESGSAPNLADLVRRAAERGGDRTALLSGAERLVWSQLDREVDAVARGLRAQGCSPGDRVAVALGNVPDFVRVYFGVLRAGLVAVPMNPGYRASELAHLLGDSGACVLVATPEVAREVAGIRDGLALRQVYVPGGGPDHIDLAVLTGAGTAGPRATPVARGEDLAVLLYTSGSEDKPKGAMLSHRALLSNLEQLDRVQPRLLGPTDVVLLGLPLFHSYGLGPGLNAIARHGCTAVLTDDTRPGHTLELLRRHTVSVVLSTPQTYRAWSHLEQVADAFTDVRLAASGAAPLDPETHHRFLDATGHRVFEGYGLTETAPVLTSTLMSPVPKPGSIGRAIPGVELELVGVDGQSVDVGDEDENASPGTDPGEIRVRGGNLFSGYWPDGRDGPGPDGWWPTADVGYADADGDLFLVDRLRELILVSGFNVYPREVEQVLGSHPAVQEAAVIGVPHEETGETVTAYVVRRPGATVSAGDLIEHCRSLLASFKCPTSVQFVDALPHSVTGKVRKSLLKDRVGDD